MDHFKEKAKDWDKGSKRVRNARIISDKILEKIPFDQVEHIMDFGAGTGLLSEGLADHVKKITAVDFSGAMLDQFSLKQWPCEIEAINIDLTKAKLDYKFDGIVSSMTLHHVKDVEGIFKKFSLLLKTGGFVGLADLYKEDGTFHSNNDSVEHFGFDEDFLRSTLKKNGFSKIEIIEVNKSSKEVAGKPKDFPIFLLTAFFE